MSDSQTDNAGKALALAGAFLQCGPLIGLIGTFVGMRRAFQTLGSSGIAQPSQVAAAIDTVLIVTAAGFVLGIIGLLLFLISHFSYRYRAPWVFNFLVIYGAVLLFAFPIGTIIGIALLVFCFTHKDEFLSRKQAPVPV